jgi:hypothetical protein
MHISALHMQFTLHRSQTIRSTSSEDLEPLPTQTWVTTRGWKPVASFLDMSIEIKLITDVSSLYFQQFYTSTFFM